MTDVTQENLRSILPAKESRVIIKIMKAEQITLKEAYLSFFTSKVYEELEHEETKRWWQSSAQLFEDWCREQESSNEGAQK